MCQSVSYAAAECHSHVRLPHYYVLQLRVLVCVYIIHYGLITCWVDNRQSVSPKEFGVACVGSLGMAGTSNCTLSPLS